MLSVLFAVAAFAQSPTVHLQGQVFAGVPGTFSAGGVGAPSVAWDPVQERYVMAFETQTGTADANCPEGYWSIGVASSEDGITWSQWGTAAVSPTPGTPWACYAVHPALVRDTDGTYHLWFKAGQGNDACNAGNPAWGCALQPGIGKVAGVIELDDKSDEIADVQAQITPIQDQIDLVIADVDVAANDFLNTLTGSTALECVDYADVCSPCSSLTLEVDHVSGSGILFEEKTLCQGFEFGPPGEVDVLAGAAGSKGTCRSYLKFTGQWGTVTCTYKGSSDAQFSPYIQQIAGGKCGVPVGTQVVRLEVENSSNLWPLTTAQVVLPATNLGSQSWQGPGYDTLVALADAAAAGDEVAVDHAEDALLVLADLRALLGTLGGPDAAALDTAAAGLETLLGQAIVDYELLDAQRQPLLDELADLQSYTKQVNLTGNDLSLQVTRGAFPTVAKVGGTWHMQVQVKRHLRAATSADGESFSLTGTGGILAGLASWSTTELLTPALTCDPSGFQTILVGRETGDNIPGGPVIQGAVGDATSTDFVSWLFNTTPWGNTGFVVGTAWRHLDVLRQGADYRIWFSEINGAGKSVIRTAEVGSPAHTGGDGRVCP